MVGVPVTENINSVLFGGEMASYSKGKLELESNLSKILLVNCKFICDSTLT